MFFQSLETRPCRQKISLMKSPVFLAKIRHSSPASVRYCPKQLQTRTSYFAQVSLRLPPSVSYVSKKLAKRKIAEKKAFGKARRPAYSLAHLEGFEPPTHGLEVHSRTYVRES